MRGDDHRALLSYLKFVSADAAMPTASRHASEAPVFAVIPAHNEAGQVGRIVRKTAPFVDKVVVVDDGSADSTFEQAQQAGADVLRNIINMGKGAALRTGCDYAIMKRAARIIVLDADGQHDPADIPRLLEELDHVRIVYTYRTFDRKMPFVFRIGNGIINATLNLLSGTSLRDTQCGYRAFRATDYDRLRWRANDYSVESEMIMRASRSHLPSRQVPIKTVYLHEYKGTTIIDGIKIVIGIILMWLRR